MSSVRLRQAGPDDLDALLALYAQLDPDDVVVATQDGGVVATCCLKVIANRQRADGGPPRSRSRAV